ncbi:MAG: uncharacterized protein KVP18_002650 [Porospora cf. gigantea A]|uniref:uncharacterized protein n=1 Tax=Porospora cf. gigantea A TaxID=2853593 RepID=UPI00355A5D16|nr:MAG: hypothetical protein KVP18_002650 [Porospora cf. gigantea A]
MQAAVPGDFSLFHLYRALRIHATRPEVCLWRPRSHREFLGFDEFTSALVTLMVQPDGLAISRLVEDSPPYPMLHSAHVDLPSVLMYPRLLKRALDEVKLVFAVSSDVDGFLDQPLTLATIIVRMYHDAGADGLPVNVNAVCLLLDVLIHAQVSSDVSRGLAPDTDPNKNIPLALPASPYRYSARCPSRAGRTGLRPTESAARRGGPCGAREARVYDRFRLRRTCLWPYYSGRALDLKTA